MRTKKKEFLPQMDRIIPQDGWVKIVQPCYYKGARGNKLYDPELMLRLYVLQNLYNLSDEGPVAEAVDSRAASNLCGAESSNQVPDGDTLGRFRNLLIHHVLPEKLFTQVVSCCRSCDHCKVKPSCLWQLAGWMVIFMLSCSVAQFYNPPNISLRLLLEFFAVLP